MKKLIITILALILFDTAFSQYVILTPPDKAVIYFVRTDRALKGGSGGLFQPVVCDGKEVVCRIVPGTFYRYECDPGEHLLWLNTAPQLSYNMKWVTFCEADLAPGKIYLMLVNTIPFKGSNIYPINPSNDWDKIEKIRSVLRNKSSISFSEYNEVNKKRKKKDPKILTDAIATILEDYYPKHKAKNRILTLEPEWYVTREELMYGKKKGDSEL